MPESIRNSIRAPGIHIRAAGRDHETGLPHMALATSTGSISSIKYQGINIGAADRDRQTGLLDDALAASQGTFSNISVAWQ